MYRRRSRENKETKMRGRLFQKEGPIDAKDLHVLSHRPIGVLEQGSKGSWRWEDRRGPREEAESLI